MIFLWPLAWGLMALALPIIALYLVKTRVPKRVVPTLLFWNAIKPRLMQQPFWRKLRRWVSLALQLLFLLLLVAALTQPQPAGESLTPRRTIFVLDTSASMRAHDVSPSRWQQGLALVLRQINGMRHFDEAAILLASDQPQILCGWSRSQRALKNSLDGVFASLRNEDVRPALAVAANLARSRDGAQVVFVSDGVLGYPVEPSALGQWLKVGGTAVNTGISLFAARRSAVSPGDFQISASVVSNETAESTVQLELTRDGHLVDVQTIHLQPGQPWQKTWKDHEPEAAAFQIKLTGMKRDDLAEDNQAEVALAPLRKVSILLVSEPNAFLEAALSAMDLTTWKRIKPGQEDAATISAADLVIYDHCAPTAPERPKAALFLDPPGEGFWGKAGGALEAPLVSDWQKEAVPLRYISLDQVRLNSARQFTPPAGASILAESFGQPLIFGDWENSPRWLTLAFGLNQSDFVLRAAFPVFLGNLVQSLRQTNDVSTATLPGPVASMLQVTLPPSDIPSAQGAVSGPVTFWNMHPLWWWLLAAGALLLLAEWRLYSRRITE